MIPQTKPEMSRISANILNVQQHLKFITNPCKKARDRKTVIFYIQLWYNYKMEIRSLSYSMAQLKSGRDFISMTSNLTWHNCFWRAKMAGSYSVRGRQEQHSQGAVLHFPEPLHINDQNCHSLFTETISETHQFVCVVGKLFYWR